MSNNKNANINYSNAMHQRNQCKTAFKVRKHLDAINPRDIGYKFHICITSNDVLSVFYTCSVELIHIVD